MHRAVQALMRRSTRAPQMPIGWAMVQLSRPFQAVLAAVALFALVWFVALHRPGSSSTDSGSSSGSSAQSSGTQAASRATTHPAGAAHSASGAHSTSVSHSTAASHTSKSSASAASAPAKGAAQHAAVHARTVTHAASHSRAAAHTGAAAHSGGTVARTRHAASRAHSTMHTGATTHKAPATMHKGPSTTHNAPSTGHAGTSSEAATVAADLKHGKTVILLFWNPSASNDVAVHQQVGDVAHKLGRSVAAFSARASQVGQFGSITRDVQVYQTPTLLIVNPKRQVTTVTGLTDAYALEQTIREARG